jgi:hypothetical protein
MFLNTKEALLIRMYLNNSTVPVGIESNLYFFTDGEVMALKIAHNSLVTSFRTCFTRH